MDERQEDRLVVETERNERGNLQILIRTETRVRGGEWTRRRVFTVRAGDLPRLVADLARVEADLADERLARSRARAQEDGCP